MKDVMSMFFLQMSGYPGSGKSTLAREITKRIPTVILDHDIMKTAMMKSLNGLIEFKEIGAVSYELEWSLADFYLSQGHSVIMDSPCLYEVMVDQGTRLAEKYKAQYKYIECFLNNYEEINQRLKNRPRMLSQIEECVSEEALLRTIERAKKPSNHEHIRVNTKEPIESYIQEVIEYLMK
jgi:predicted kinase